MSPKNVFITGCGPSGIGAALAAEFHLRGHQVFASGLSESLLTSLVDLGIQTLVMDVTSASSIENAVAEVKKATGGGLDILINNAGTIQVMPFADMKIEDARHLFDVNVIGMMAVTKAFLPLLLASEGESTVANLASVNSVFRPAFFSTYNASKAAVETFSATIRAELAPLGIRVVTLKTGSVKTHLFDAPSRLPEGSLYTPIRDFIENKKMFEHNPWMEPDQFAKKIVSKLLRSSVKSVIWQGGLSTVAWILTWLPEWTMDTSIVMKAYGLNKIRRP